MTSLTTYLTYRRLLSTIGLYLLLALNTPAQPSSTDSLQQALSVANHDTTRAQLLKQLVWKYTFTQPDTAMSYGERFLTISRALGDTANIIESSKAMGTIYAMKADYAKALEYFFRALDLAQRTRDLSRSFDLLMGIGNVTKGQGDLVQSQHYYQQALTIGHQLQDTTRLIAATINIGAILFDQEKYQQSIQFNRRAVGWIEANNVQHRQLGYALINIGSAEEALGHHTTALEYLRRGLASIRSIGDEHTETVILHNLAETYLNINKLDSALIYSQRVLDKAKTASFTKEESDAYLLLSTIHEAQGEYNQALQYHKKHLAFQDSIFSQTSAQQIAELQTQYETQQKEQKITALTQERELQNLRAEQMSQRQFGLILGSVLLLALLGVTYNRYWLKKRTLSTIRIQKQAIEAKNAENELLIREIHHRVKNNLQIIMSLLNTQIKVLSDPRMIEVINESRNRVKSMSLIHEKLYQANNFTQVPVRSYLSEMARNVAQAYQQRVQLHLNVEPIEINVSIAVPLGLMVNELLTNAYKYAFQEKVDARLSVVFRSERINDHHHYHLQIADNGKGLPPDFDLDRSRSFGLKLVKGLTYQLDGRLQVQSSAGTTFSIKFKEAVQTF